MSDDVSPSSMLADLIEIFKMSQKSCTSTHVASSIVLKVGIRNFGRRTNVVEIALGVPVRLCATSLQNGGNNGKHSIGPNEGFLDFLIP